MLRRANVAGAAALTVLALTFAARVPAARADGDPASDVLASQALFLPQDAGVSSRGQAELSVTLQAARASGYPLHIAVIAGPGDLGSVGALWRQPQAYARFLGQEIALTVRGPLLVVMPDGFGYLDLASAGAAARPLPSALAGLPAPGPGPGLEAGTVRAVRGLAAAAGHPLAAVQSASAASAAPSSALPWGVFAAGAVLVALAWTLSLRAAPPGWWRGRPSS